MKVQNNKVVAVSYALEVEGRIADQSAPGQPLEYIHGTGMLLPKFEAALLDKEPGDGFDFILSPEDGYGVYEPGYKFDIPKTAFEIDGKVREDLLVVGRTIPMLNQNGQVVQGTVAEVKAEAVTIHECPHGKGGCHKEDGECCHEGKGHGDGECCHEGEGHGDGECCGKGEGCCHKD